jgi:hypothetical protein
MNSNASQPNKIQPPRRGTGLSCGIAGQSPRRQRGSLLALFVIALLPLLAMVGLALDMGHLYLSRTRFQNTVDVAALSAAKTLNDLGQDYWTTARDEAYNVCERNWLLSGIVEFDDPCQRGAPDSLEFDYSNTLPFAAGTTPGQFVRVRLPNVVQTSWFIQVLNLLGYDFTSVNVGQITAIAGPSSRLTFPANIVPWLACEGAPPQLTNPPRILSEVGACPGNSCIANDYKNTTYYDGRTIPWMALPYASQTDRTVLYNALKTRILREPFDGLGNTAGAVPTYNIGGTVNNGTNKGYTTYKSFLTSARLDNHPRIITVPVVDCPGGVPNANPSIIRFDCFFIREACEKSPTGNGCKTTLQNGPSLNFVTGNSFERVADCLNQGAGPVGGGTLKAGPYTLILYPSQ